MEELLRLLKEFDLGRSSSHDNGRMPDPSFGDDTELTSNLYIDPYSASFSGSTSRSSSHANGRMPDPSFRDDTELTSNLYIDPYSGSSSGSTSHCHKEDSLPIPSRPHLEVMPNPFFHIAGSGLVPNYLFPGTNIPVFPSGHGDPLQDAIKGPAKGSHDESMVVYCATGENGKFYIGRTTQKLATRIKQHEYDVKSGKGTTGFSKEAINEEKSGRSSNWKFTVLDRAETKQELAEKENYWIQQGCKGSNESRILNIQKKASYGGK